MVRDNRLFKIQTNQLLQFLSDLEPGSVLGSENELAMQLDVSRTTVRAVLTRLAEQGIVRWEGREKLLSRLPEQSDYFEAHETRMIRDLVEEKFLNWVLRGDLPPGTIIHEAQLARDFGVSVGSLREFLIRFVPVGLIEKHPNRAWVLKGFTRAFADEMFVVREMFEKSALQEILSGRSKIELAELQGLAREHQRIISGTDREAMGFPILDARFHRMLARASNNRFILDFSEIIALIVHFHYRWNKIDEVARNRTAAAEHIDVIEALIDQDAARAITALDHHLAMAYRSLIASVRWSGEESDGLEN